MHGGNRARQIYRWFRHRGRVEAELEEEVAGYFEVMVERRMARGLSREDAQREARLEFDTSGHVKEKVREAVMGNAVETTLQDLRYAARVLRKNPGFTAVAVLSLGLGLGANTAIFSLVNTVMLKSLPVTDAQRLVFVDNSGGKSEGGSGPPYPCYEILRDNNHYFSAMSAFSGTRFKVTIDGAQESINGQYASGNYFDVLGVGAALGRPLTPADDALVGRGGPEGAMAVISYGLWNRRFGRSPSVLGKTVQVGTNWVTIVGVTPPGFSGLEVGAPVDITIPMMLANVNFRSRGNWWFSVIGRLKEGTAAEAARAELDRYFKAYMDDSHLSGPAQKYFTGIVLVPAVKGLGTLRRKFSKPLLIVMTIAGLVLLIGCANVANLLLARASARRNEIALRLAIGASRARLMRQLFTEGLLLAVLSAAAGFLFARWGVSLLVTLFAGIRGRIVLEPNFDTRVMAFAAAIALLTGLLFSIMPALHATRTDAAKPGGNRTGAGASPFGVGNALVVIQITLSVVLLCGASLFLRSLHNLTQMDAGFEREGILTMQVDTTMTESVPKEGKAIQEQFARLGRMWEELVEPVSTLAPVRAASVSTLNPMSGRDRGILMEISGEVPRPNTDRGTHINQVTEGYFATFGVTLLTGRLFTPGDVGNSRRVAILNESAVRAAFHGSNPLGRSVHFPGQRASMDYEVVGTVKDARYENLRKPAEPMVYVPIEQSIDPLTRVAVAVRTRGDVAGMETVVRRRVRDVIPGGFASGVATVHQQVDESLLEERLVSILASLFGGLALLLAAIGIYGIMAFAVIRRTREIGIRIAVGAQRSEVLWLVWRHAFALAVTGLAVGMPLVFLAKRYIESELYGVTGDDPAAIASAAVLLVLVALAAGSWPAWRASRVDPMVSLRQE